MVIPTLLSKHREAITSRSKTFFEEIQKARPLNKEPLEDVIDTLSTFITRGKLLRGCMLMEMYELLSGKLGAEISSAGLGIECIHTSLLIHDDVIDHDTFRRDVPTVHVHYQQIAQKNGISDPVFYGQMIATILGDMGFFLGLRLINQVLTEKTTTSIHEMLTRELWLVGEAQLFDFHFGMTSEEPTNETIETIYRYKTGRYTFSLPLCIGATLAGASEDEIASLEKYGEHIGIIFQIKDDELGFFGSTENIGKEVGSDIRENKKTIIRKLLFDKLSDTESKTVKPIFGKKEVTKEELDYLYNLCKKYDIRKSLDTWIHTEEKKAYEIVKESPCNSATKNFLEQLIEFNVTRTK